MRRAFSDPFEPAHFGRRAHGYDSIPPFFWMEEFIGPFQLPRSWSLTETGAGSSADNISGSGGIMQLLLPATSAAREASVDTANILNLPVNARLLVEFRMALLAVGSNTTAVAGVSSNHETDKDAVTRNAWFRWDGDFNVKLESDNESNVDDVATGVTVVGGEFNIYQIDFEHPEDARFFVNGEAVGLGTTFNLVSSSDMRVQPMVSVQKSTGADEPLMRLDYFKAWCDRPLVTPGAWGA